MLRLPARGPDQMRGEQDGMRARTRTHTHIHNRGKTPTWQHAVCVWMLRCIIGAYNHSLPVLAEVAVKSDKNTPAHWSHYPRPCCCFLTQRKQPPKENAERNPTWPPPVPPKHTKTHTPCHHISSSQSLSRCANVSSARMMPPHCLAVRSDHNHLNGNENNGGNQLHTKII